MMRRARWWHEAGGLAISPTVVQLSAALQPWRHAGPGLPWLGLPWPGLPWLGLPLPTPLLVIALERSRDPDTIRWLSQLLLPEPEVLRACARRTPRLVTQIEATRAMSSSAGLPAFLHRTAQIPFAELAWFTTHDVTGVFPERAWPPADDHFPAEIHGHRTVRTLRGLPGLVPAC